MLKGRPVDGGVSEHAGDLPRPDSGHISELGAGPSPVKPAMTTPRVEVLVKQSVGDTEPVAIKWAAPRFPTFRNCGIINTC